jgi:hypothetical protein
MIDETIGFCRQKITIINENEDEVVWPRGVDAVVCRLPSEEPLPEGDLNFAQKVDQCLTPNGWMIVFSFSPQKWKTRSYEFIAAAAKTGLTLVDVIVTVKPWWGGQKSDSHLTCTYEHILLFTKAKRWALNRESINSILKYPDDSDSCPGNAWWLAKHCHSEVYPPDVCSALLKMIELLPGSVVLDPIMGGDAGIRSSVHCGYSFIGYEPDVKKYSSYVKTIKKAEKQLKKRDIEQQKGLIDVEF